MGYILKQLLTLFVIIIITDLSCTDLFSQNTQTKPTRQSSLEAFSNGNYEKAYSEFKELLEIYSKDPLYKYYSGVCLVKLNRDPEEAVSYLSKALQSATVVRTLPSDALFYLGRAQQMSGKFNEALESFNRYSDQIGKKKAREQNIPDFIQECKEKKGELSESVSAKIVKKENAETAQTDIKPVEKTIILQHDGKDTSSIKNLPPDYDKILNEALEFQIEADSLNAIVANQKKEVGKIPDIDKAAYKAKISQNEALAASFQKSADQKYNQAQEAMKPQAEITNQKSVPQPSEKEPIRQTVVQTEKKAIQNTTKQSDNKPITEVDKRSVEVIKTNTAVKKPVETFSFFEILPKPVTNPKEKIVINPEVPEGLIYRIQLAVFRNPVAPSYFKGIKPIYGLKAPGTDKTNYYAGMFRRSSDANKALSRVKAKGFKEAFVVPLSGNKVVSADRAAILEKEWGKKPFIDITKYVLVAPSDTIPPTLSFRVEVVRSLKPLKEDIIEGIKKVAGNRGLDVQSLGDGNTTYLVGKFITFESASEYADLLVRNGYREARVVAWLGKNEIPVETARKLFDNL